MAKVDLELVRKLRERTGIGMMDCKKALIEANGDIEKAVELLRKKGASVAAKRASMETSQGLVHSYIHTGAQVGVLIEINCETDFVARTDDVKQFAHDICLQIAATKPKCLLPEDLDEEFLNKEKEILREQLLASKKPENIIEKIMEGKLEKIYAEVCLMRQKFVKDDKLTIDDLLKNLIGKMGEKITIKRFSCFVVGS